MTALLVLAQSGRGGDSGDSGDGLLILLGVAIAVAIVAFVAFRLMVANKRKSRSASGEGKHPPDRVGH